MAEMDAAATADGEILAVEIGVLELIGSERIEVEIGIFI
jgi:hypothetical protein